MTKVIVSPGAEKAKEHFSSRGDWFFSPEYNEFQANCDKLNSAINKATKGLSGQDYKDAIERTREAHPECHEEEYNRLRKQYQDRQDKLKGIKPKNTFDGHPSVDDGA